ncbi:hypothetical protein L873DRAFT_1819964 [Choiromyces venosus 120613-1]|uniref:Uncharacterized protein n=1 Tax=Choiromyces venosus 120613-1 TaxID=1336337 RepID=A0A3N4J1N5_9PEZI|nr:hypothetical protein L873DRAFT_1819964 [Choiromyces venosus 120613-1]
MGEWEGEGVVWAELIYLFGAGLFVSWVSGEWEIFQGLVLAGFDLWVDDGYSRW